MCSNITLAKLFDVGSQILFNPFQSYICRMNISSYGHFSDTIFQLQCQLTQILVSDKPE